MNSPSRIGSSVSMVIWKSEQPQTLLSMRKVFLSFTYYPCSYVVNSSNYSRILDHCLNVLLKGVRCRADTTLSGWFLKEDDIHKPLINRGQAEHVCVKWSSVLDWLHPRAVSPSEAVLTKQGKISQENMLPHIRVH